MKGGSVVYEISILRRSPMKTVIMWILRKATFLGAKEKCWQSRELYLQEEKNKIQDVGNSPVSWAII